MRLGSIELFNPVRIIGDVDGRPPLLKRWVLFRCATFGIYLHHLCRSDYDRALHDHPWGFYSLILWGGYVERYDASNDPAHPVERETWRGPLSIAYRPATWRHRVILPEGRTAWSLLLVEPRSRKWGFWVGEWMMGLAHDFPVWRFKWCHWRHFDTARNICADDPVWPDRDGDGDEGAHTAMKGSSDAARMA